MPVAKPAKVNFERKNEFGAFVQINPYNNNKEDFNLMGFSYKTQKTERFTLRFMAAYGDYNTQDQKSYVSYVSDTFVSKGTKTHISLGMLGGGIEVQRKFYKKVYLFAAVELRAGYGSGTIDSFVQKDFASNSAGQLRITESYGAGQGDANMFHASISPSIGAKLQFKRISFGTEMFTAQLSYNNTTYRDARKYNMSVMNFDLGNISHRFFFNYRF
jgi:hypothetical protein